MQTRKAKILKKLRQSTVEPVIGTLVNYLGIKRVNTKGLSQANKCLTMASIAYNLKKMLKYKPRLVQDNMQGLKNGLKKLFNVSLYFVRLLYVTLWEVSVSGGFFCSKNIDFELNCATATSADGSYRKE
jgi:Transposase DDE domain